MGLINSNLTTPELLGRLRHLYNAIGAVILGIGITSPNWMPLIFSEAFTEVLFIVIGGAISILQMIRSVNSPDKKSAARVTMTGITMPPELAGMIRQVLTMGGMILIALKINVPDFVLNLFTEQAAQLIIDAIGMIITLVSFLLSKRSEEKQISETEFAALRKAR